MPLADKGVLYNYRVELLKLEVLQPLRLWCYRALGQKQVHITYFSNFPPARGTVGQQKIFSVPQCSTGRECHLVGNFRQVIQFFFMCSIELIGVLFHICNG